MKEGRQAISTFNVSVYKTNNLDLQKAFGSDLLNIIITISNTDIKRIEKQYKIYGDRSIRFIPFYSLFMNF